MREREEENETKCPLSTDKTPKKLTQKVSINKRTAYFELLGSEKKKEVVDTHMRMRCSKIMARHRTTDHSKLHPQLQCPEDGCIPGLVPSNRGSTESHSSQAAKRRTLSSAPHFTFWGKWWEVPCLQPHLSI